MCETGFVRIDQCHGEVKVNFCHSFDCNMKRRGAETHSTFTVKIILRFTLESDTLQQVVHILDQDESEQVVHYKVPREKLFIDILYNGFIHTNFLSVVIDLYVGEYKQSSAQVLQM